MATIKTSVVFTDDAGKVTNFDYPVQSVYLSAPPVTPPPAEPPPPVVVEPPPPPPPAPTSTIPLSWDDARFAANTTASSTKIANGGTLKNKTITDTGQVASIVTGNGATIQNCRIKSREGIRVGGGGNFLIDGCYIEAIGVGDDHADGIQAYAPGGRGDIKILNSTIKCGGSATAGLFIADNWTDEPDAEPTVDLDNVVFLEGPFGLRLHADVGGDINVSLKDVYFIGPFTYKPFYFLNYGGHKVVIKKWENVRAATLANGGLVPGNLIPKP